MQIELPHGVYRIDGQTLKVTRVIDELAGPNGLCFSPDEKTLYVVEGRAKPNRLVWAYAVNADGSLGARRKHIDGGATGALDGIKCDEAGNLWCGWGSNGSPKGKPEELQGHRPRLPAGTLRQPVLRRRPGQPPVHGQQPLHLLAVREHSRRHLQQMRHGPRPPEPWPGPPAELARRRQQHLQPLWDGHCGKHQWHRCSPSCQ